MGEANKFNAFNKRAGRGCQTGRGGDSLFVLPLFSPKNTSYEFHGSRWQNESVTITRSPLFKYHRQLSESCLLPILVRLPDKFLLIPQEPAHMSPPLWGFPGLPHVEPMAPSPLFPRPSSIFSKDLLSRYHLVMCLSPQVNWELPGLRVQLYSFSLPQHLIHAHSGNR